MVAVLAAFTGNIALAEDLAQEALADALRQWPVDGTPLNPGAWLTAVGKRKAVDAFRRQRVQETKYAQIGRELGAGDVGSTSLDSAGDAHEIDDERLARLSAVLEVVYLIFNEGYSATSGEQWTRPELCGEALRLGRVLAALLPTEPEVHGLVALMEFHSSRLRARTGAAGEPLLLLEQDRRLWDRLHIGRGEAALARVDELTHARGPYSLQAAIAGCHARTFRPEETDWAEIVRLYTSLAELEPSPIVELNRAVAVSRASGPTQALALVDLIVATGALERYHLLYSVRGDLLDQLGRHEEAAAEFDHAAELTANGQERALLRGRARQSLAATVVAS